jgi:hypothetical protein
MNIYMQNVNCMQVGIRYENGYIGMLNCWMEGGIYRTVF